MKSSIYFIDNNLYETCKVIDAMKKYFRDRVQQELDSTMFLININGDSDEETIKYFSDIFEKNKTNLKECKSMEEIKESIADISTENTIVMVDLHMVESEEKIIDEDADYKCISLQCMEELERVGISYVWYSSYAGSKFKDHLQSRFQKLYNKEIPTIYQRDDLIQAHFRVAVAKEILGV